MNLQEALSQQYVLGGIDIRQLSPGVQVVCETLYSTYTITILDDPGYVIVDGGAFSEPTKVVFAGSNFGGSAIKLGWIGYNMRLEFVKDGINTTTSRVQAAKVIGPESSYQMDWNPEQSVACES